MRITTIKDEEAASASLPGRSTAWAETEIENISLEEQAREKSPHNEQKRHQIVPQESQPKPSEETAPERKNTEDKLRTETSVVALSIRKETRMVDKNKTVFNAVIKNEVVRQRLNRIYKSMMFSVLTAVIWILNDVVALSYCFRVQLVSPYIYGPFQIIYAINFCIVHSIFIRIDIVRELAKSFNFWYTICNCVSFHVCMIALWGFSLETLFVVSHSMPSIMLLILFDAHAAKRSPVMKMVVFVGIVSYLPIVVVLVLKLVDFENEKIYYREKNYQIVDIRLQAIDNSMTMVIYLLRIFYMHVILKKPTTIAFYSNFYEIAKEAPARNIFDGIDNIPKESIADANNMTGVACGEVNSMISPKVSIEMNQYSPPEPSAIEHNPNKDVSDPSMEVGNRPNQADNKNYMIIGIMESKTITYDLRQTIFHRHIKHKFPMLYNVVKSKYYNMFGILINILSTIISLPLSSGIRLGYAVEYLGTIIVVLGISYITIQITITCNFFMFHHMVRSFDFWFVMFLVSKAFLSSGILCRWDSRVIYWFFIVLALSWSVMIDTFHIKYRKSSYIALIGITWGIISTIFSKVNYGYTFERDRFIYFRGAQIISAKISLTTSTISAWVFFIRFLWTYHRNRNRILFITENIKVEPIAQ